MDLHHIGQLCSVEMCGVKDYLAFFCKHCQLSYCLSHRSHPCKNTLATDPNPPPPIASTKKTKCPVVSCHHFLGISNHFSCPKCQQSVCLSHRFPELHACKEFIAAKRVAFLESQFINKTE
jgi:hypothetical protein